MAASPSMDFPNTPSNLLNIPVAFDVEISDCSGSTASVPKRVKRRLENIENRSRSPASLQDIEAKLKEADVRRQQFHEWLANKARPKLRSSLLQSGTDDRAQRLEAKLVAAEQKRLELIAQEQTRLARLHELRVAARTEVQLRAEREREELGSKVESRVQHAETKRLALLEAERQRRAAVHERMAQSIIQRNAQEGKQQERTEALRTLICQKVAAAQEKRAGILKAEKTRAQAIVSQARKVARSVLREREIELRNKKEQLEARLQRAKRQRAEYLRQRGGCRGTCHNNRHKMRKHGDRLCRKLTRCWRQFRRSRRTTLSLAQDFSACAINQQSVTSLPFEELASRITCATSLCCVKALLARIESRFVLSSASQSNVGNIDHLLKRLFPSSKKTSPTAVRAGKKSSVTGFAGRSNGLGSAVLGSDSPKIEQKKIERYPARVFLCAYMIIGHPEAVFSSRGEREVALAEAAAKLLPEFETLISIILDGPSSSSHVGPSSPKSFSDMENVPQSRPFSAQLAAFDASWCSYLYQFVAWKVEDAQMLEEELIRVACQLEVSMLKKCKARSDDDAVDLSHDTQAILKQVLEDQQLIRERVSRLTGSAGVARVESALLDVRNRFVEAKENGTPLPSPFQSPLPRYGSSSHPESKEGFMSEETPSETSKPKVVRALFPDAESKTEGIDEVVSVPFKELSNEMIVNEALHEPNWMVQDARSGLAAHIPGKLAEIQTQIKATMENAFWNSIAEGLSKDPPDYQRVVSLLNELKDELAALVPESWKLELHDNLDTEIFSQVLTSGCHDYDYFHRLLEYALNLVLKLGAPARDDDARAAHHSLIQELSNIASVRSEHDSFGYTLIKGLRFVFEQVQVLKADISAARIQVLAPYIRGTAGIEYLQNVFAKQYQISAATAPYLCIDVRQNLPKTYEWFTSVAKSLEEQKQEVETASSSLAAGSTTHTALVALPPSSSLRTGGRTLVNASLLDAKGATGSASRADGRVFHWKSVSTYVRLGLLLLTCKLEPVTVENVVETLALNVHRLRKVQNEYQRIVVIATGLLLLRQTITNMEVSVKELEKTLKNAADRLHILLDQDKTSSSDIGKLLGEITADLGCKSDKNESELMTRVLNRSLSSDDPIFVRVSAAVRAGLRALILFGEGEGSALTVLALQRIGASCLVDMLSALAIQLDRLAFITCQVHEPWYASIIDAV